jgi:hypothetical protein
VVDNRTLLARRVGAAGVVIVVVLLVVLGLRAYFAAQARDAAQNYNTQVTQLAALQSTQVAAQVFSDLNAAVTENDPGSELPVELYELSEVARNEAQTAEGWSVPSEMVGAQSDLLLALNLRAEAILNMSKEIAPAFGTSGQVVAMRDLAGSMQMLNAADIIWATQVQPLVAQGLQSAGIQVVGSADNAVASSKLLPNNSWMITSYVASKLLGYLPGALGGTAPSGTNGHKLIGVTVNGQTLGSTPTTLTYTAGMQFYVDFENTGTNVESGVQVKVTLTAASVAGIITGSATQAETVPGMTYEVPVTLSQQPAVNTPLALTAEVVPVPGETNKANNKATYYVEFSS